ncbi:hypothetical protein FRC18_003748 [Serendipita sp. 400]|nr:hypothetical protein FRC18_003748 [Serendipita sp. 400]
MIRAKNTSWGFVEDSEKDRKRGRYGPFPQNHIHLVFFQLLSRDDRSDERDYRSRLRPLVRS